MDTLENNITEAILLSAGYKKYVSESTRTFKSTNTMYQKKVKDDVGVKYFINVYEYKFIDRDNKKYLSYQSEVQFNGELPEDSLVTNTIEVILFERNLTKVEATFENMWETLKLGYEEHY